MWTMVFFYNHIDIGRVEDVSFIPPINAAVCLDCRDFLVNRVNIDVDSKQIRVFLADE
jgi:hypothetical protein